MFPTGTDIDLISPGLAADLRSHNEFGARLGCWKRPQATLQAREEMELR